MMEGTLLIIPLIVMFVCKVLGANLMRIYLNKVAMEDE